MSQSRFVTTHDQHQGDIVLETKSNYTSSSRNSIVNGKLYISADTVPRKYVRRPSQFTSDPNKSPPLRIFLEQSIAAAAKNDMDILCKRNNQIITFYTVTHPFIQTISALCTPSKDQSRKLLILNLNLKWSGNQMSRHRFTLSLTNPYQERRH